MVDPVRDNPGATPTPGNGSIRVLGSGLAPASPVRIDPPAARAPEARIALAHDWLVGVRGGERVLEAILRFVDRAHRPTRLYTLLDDGSSHGPAIDSIERVGSPLRRVPAGAGRLRRWLLPLYPAAVRALSRRMRADHEREPIDLLISTSSSAIKGVRPPAGVPHLCYCHSPARYAWSQGASYAASSRAIGLGLDAYGPWFRRWDRRSASHVTRFIANSAHTAGEIRRCYGREARVIHPPARTAWFTPDPSIAREGFWVCAGALEPYKRADLAIEAARLAGVELVVAGDGSQRERLRRRPPPHVRFLGRVTDEVLRDLFRRARLLVMPQVEDFGIVAVEAQACGCPVLARNAGGARDSVMEGRTGALFDEPDPGAIAAAARRVPSDADKACRRHAERFDEARFESEIAREIASMLAGRDPAEAHSGSR